MTYDIVERLRGRKMARVGAKRLGEEAAAEIERLRCGMNASWIYPVNRYGKTWPIAVQCSCGMQWHIDQPAPIGCLQHLMGLEALMADGAVC